MSVRGAEIRKRSLETLGRRSFDLLVIGGGEQVVRQLLELVAAVPGEVREFILARVADFQFATLGPLGGALLLATTVLAIGNVERALNAVWGVREARPWMRRVPDYLAVLVVS